MTRHTDDPERRPGLERQLAGLSLFEPAPATAIDLGMAALDRTAAKNAEMIARLAPLALELARKAHPAGVTVSDLRLYAVQRGLLTGTETGRTLSYLGAVMRTAGLVNTGVRRRSHLPVTHAITQTVWVMPDDPRAA